MEEEIEKLKGEIDNNNLKRVRDVAPCLKRPFGLSQNVVASEKNLRCSSSAMKGDNNQDKENDYNQSITRIDNEEAKEFLKASREAAIYERLRAEIESLKAKLLTS